MKKMELTENWLVGHKDIDREHTELVSIVNEMVDCVDVHDVTLFESVLSLLCKKIEMHFHNESEIMKELGYAGKNRSEEHGIALRNIKEIASEINEQNMQNKLQHIISVIVEKILKDDIYFAEHLVTINYKD